MTKTAQILQSMTILRPHFPRGVMCCQIASECRLTRQDIEKLICYLVTRKKVHVVGEALNNMGNPANVYCLTTGVEPVQMGMF